MFGLCLNGACDSLFRAKSSNQENRLNMDIKDMALSAAGMGSMGKTVKILLVVILIFLVMGTAAFFIGK